VISRTTAFSFKDAGLTVSEIADSLGVAHVLAGSVRTGGNTIRITAQLIDPRTDAQLFSETFDRSGEDIFAIQEEIAAKVVSELRITLLGELPTLQETDPQAYALFLQARHVKNNGDYSEEWQATTIAMFERVRELVPDYAPTYAELAGLYANQVALGYQGREEGLQMARDAGERGLALDPDLVYAHAMLGFTSLIGFDLEGSARHLERAMEMDPNHPDVLMNVGILLSNLGRNDEAIPFYAYVRDRDPVNQVNLINLAFSYSDAGRWEEAISTIRTLGSLEPSALGTLAYTYYFAGRWEEAISTGREMSERGQSSPEMHAAVSLSLLQMGDFEGALAEAELESDPGLRLHCLALANYALGRQTDFERAFEESKSFHGDFPQMVAAVYAYMGDIDTAFEWLQDVSPNVTAYGGRFDPIYAALHDDPRWATWLAKEEDNSAAISFDVRLPR
jgi:adenylate cyclase